MEDELLLKSTWLYWQSSHAVWRWIEFIYLFLSKKDLFYFSSIAILLQWK